jgi:hypothetical protein
MRLKHLLFCGLAISIPRAVHAQGLELAFGDDSARAVVDTVPADSARALPAVQSPASGPWEIVFSTLPPSASTACPRPPQHSPGHVVAEPQGWLDLGSNGISPNGSGIPTAGPSTATWRVPANSRSGATPMTLAGSLMWELFGEPVQPSINDVVITSLSGVNFGESIRRISDLLLDNQARGMNRVWREAVVLLMNPGMGVDRLSRGQTWQQRANPLDQHPDQMRTEVALGVKRMATTERTGAGIDVAVFGLDLDYGDPFAGSRVQPFSSFTFSRY